MEARSLLLFFVVNNPMVAALCGVVGVKVKKNQDKNSRWRLGEWMDGFDGSENTEDPN